MSGEGVVHAIRDAKRNEQGKIEDEGVHDKRLFVTESEFASVLSVFARKENTLAAILRNAWDSKTLRTLAKIVGEVANEPHVSLVAHITVDELKTRLAKDDWSNGVANRFLWICARRSKLLPHGGTLRAADCRLGRNIGSGPALAGGHEMAGSFRLAVETADETACLSPCKCYELFIAEWPVRSR